VLWKKATKPSERKQPSALFEVGSFSCWKITKSSTGRLPSPQLKSGEVLKSGDTQVLNSKVTKSSIIRQLSPQVKQKDELAEKVMSRAG